MAASRLTAFARYSVYLMTVVFLTSASTSPWSKPGDWTDAGHTVELIGGGARGNPPATGTSGRGGGGGGAGGYCGCSGTVTGTMGSTTPFAVGSNNTTTSQLGTAAAYWQATSSGNCYQAAAGVASATATSGGSGGTAANCGLSGTPTIT